MKKKLLAVLLTAVMVLSLAACGKDETSSKKKKDTSVEETIEEKETEKETTETSTEVSVSVETPVEDPSGNTETEGYSVSELVDIYAPLLKDLSRTIYLGAEPVYDELYGLYSEAIYMTMEEKSHIGFCFYDIDGDGKMEIIIGKGDYVYAIGSYAGDGPYVLKGAGYRSILNIYETGLIVYEGSSGAWSYSYDFYTYDGVELILQDYFYTEPDENFEQIYYYHNTTGDWNESVEDRITEAEYNIMTDVGVERVSFSDLYIPIGEYKDRFCDVRSDFTLEEICPENVVWELEQAESIYGIFPVEELGYTESLVIRTDLTAYFYKNYVNFEESVDDAPVSYYEDSLPFYTIEFNFDGRYEFIYILGLTMDGYLLTQRTWYNNSTGNYNVQYEYFKPVYHDPAVG